MTALRSIDSIGSGIPTISAVVGLILFAAIIALIYFYCLGPWPGIRTIGAPDHTRSSKTGQCQHA